MSSSIPSSPFSYFPPSTLLIPSPSSNLGPLCFVVTALRTGEQIIETRSADTQMLLVPIPKSSNLVLSICTSRLHVSPYSLPQNQVPLLLLPASSIHDTDTLVSLLLERVTNQQGGRSSWILSPPNRSSSNQI